MEWNEDETEDQTPTPPADLAEALGALALHADPTRAAAIARKNKIDREVLGVELPVLSDLANAWRAGLTLEARLSLADQLWQSGSLEARIMAAKLLTQARIRPDDSSVWEMIKGWSAEFDSPLIADQVARAAERRLQAAPERLDEVEAWLASDDPWQRRAALIYTLPWASLVHPKSADLAARARVLGWAERLSSDDSRLVQQALAQWLRELSRRSPDLTRSFLMAHGLNLPIFARIEAAQLLAEPVEYPKPEPVAPEADEADLEDEFDEDDFDDDEDDEADTGDDEDDDDEDYEDEDDEDDGHPRR